MDAITPVKLKRPLLPVLAEAISEWFPELGGRALAVSECTVTKENVPTLPLAMLAFVRSAANPTTAGRNDNFMVTDNFIIEFWMQPERYKKANGSETPFWSYYPYEAIRQKLLDNLLFWDAPNCERIVYRGLSIDAEAIAVTLTFSFTATFNWGPESIPRADGVVSGIGINLCTPPPCIIEDCQPDDPCNPPITVMTIGGQPTNYALKMIEALRGPPGPPGPPGPQGPAGVSTTQFGYRADTQSQQASDPGTAKLRWNAATMAEATALYVDNVTSGGFDPTALFTSAHLNDELIIQDRDVATNYQRWRITGPGIAHSGWFEVPVEFIELSGSGANFSNNQELAVLAKWLTA